MRKVWLKKGQNKKGFFGISPLIPSLLLNLIFFKAHVTCPKVVFKYLKGHTFVDARKAKTNRIRSRFRARSPKRSRVNAMINKIHGNICTWYSHALGNPNLYVNILFFCSQITSVLFSKFFFIGLQQKNF